MRRLTDHKLNGLNDALTITVLDEPGQGGACHEYSIFSAPANSYCTKCNGYGGTHTKPDCNGTFPGSVSCQVRFQNGPIQEHGVNGISGEALLAIVIDRLRCFQAGQYSCRENAIALTHCEDALHWLQHRTRQRLERGVEGTSQK